ncbi:MAG: hypothetical protein P8123_02195 [bacterium]
MKKLKAPYYPIIYVRGYAMTARERDAATADPFCGFNSGSTVYRAALDKEKPAKKFVFESPVLRLVSDYQYVDVYDNGLDIMDAAWEGAIPPMSIVIYRYYEETSRLLGSGQTSEIQDFAKGLSKLILRVRDLVCNKEIPHEDFRCYLVAHSMGGLICRAFLQNPALGDDRARRCVDKVFTYATPHNGIEMAGINVRNWMTVADADNFNRERMAKYLKLGALYKRSKRVDWLPEDYFPTDRFFCMIGTNRGDYDSAMGLSRTFSGHGGDGLVKIANASVWGTDAKGQKKIPCATAYAFRSHSGYFGIVNSEEAYQNLTRFLFGNVRVDIWLDVEAVELPPGIQDKDVDALYQFELLVSPRGKRWYLTRRMAEEDSVACRRHKELSDPANKSARQIYLSTVFLDRNARVDREDPSLSYALTLGVRVPDYEVDRRFWYDWHFEGGYLFRDTLTVKISKASKASGRGWDALTKWQNWEPPPGRQSIDYKTLKDGKQEMAVLFSSSHGNSSSNGTGSREERGNIAGWLRFVISPWNK